MFAKLLNTLTLVLLSIAVYAQCPGTLSGPGLDFSPAAGSSLPDAEVSQPYSSTIEVFVPAQHVVDTTLVNVQYFHVIKFVGAPLNTTFTTSTGTDSLTTGSSCVTVVNGQILEPTGAYTLGLMVKVIGTDTSGASFGGFDTIATFDLDVVYGTPVAEAYVNGSTTVCQDAQLIFSPMKTYGNASYNWTATGATRVGVPTQKDTFAFPTPGTFDVILTATDVGTAYDTVTVNVIAKPSVSISATGFSASCGGSAVLAYSPSGTFKVDAPKPGESYQWYENRILASGATDTSFVPTVTSGAISVSATSNGCSASSNVFGLTNVLLFDVELCVVTVDSATGKNLLVWEKDAANSCADSIKIYKEGNVTGVYNLLATLDYNDFSTYLDMSSNPDQQADKYRITVQDVGLESAQSTPHKSIHLTINQGQGSTRNLLWNEYEGAPVASYNIYRGTSSTNMTLYASVSGSNTSYTDLNPLGSANVYQIEVVLPYACNPSKTGQATTRSNVADDNDIASGISYDVLQHELSIAPNPATGLVTIDAGSMEVSSLEILSIDGRRMLSADDFVLGTPKRIDISELTPGLYLVNVKLTTGQFLNRKLLVH